MAGRYPTSTLLRFPLLFGGILILLGTGFTYRRHFMTDLDDKRNELLKENPEDRLLIEQFKRKFVN